MTRVERLEREIERLLPEERVAFREWYEAFDAAEWDRQMEADVAAGKLDRVATAACPTTPLRLQRRPGRHRAGLQSDFPPSQSLAPG